MRIRQIEYFLAVVDEGSIGRAAIRLSVAQPSLSQQIAALERDIGGRLLERTPRGVTLTSAGRAFEPEARAAIQAIQRARAASRGTMSMQSGELVIATVLSVAAGLLPAAISEWNNAHPAITIGLREYRHKRALEQSFLSGQGDVAIGPRPQRWTGPVKSLGYESFVIVLPASDPHAGRKRIAISELADRNWVLFDRDHGLSELVDSVCAEEGFLPQGLVRTSQCDAMLRLVAAGIGPAILPSNVIPKGAPITVVTPTRPLLRELTAFSRDRFTAPAASFIGTLAKSATALLTAAEARRRDARLL